MFSSVLIANRGEIACRIIRSARALGMRTIAVYSQADAGALHVRLADEAHPIGPPEPSESYLNGERIIETALKAGAQCIHPGYGFLAENAGFAEACAKAGLVFVGPPPDAIRAMGLKDAAKALMETAGVPVVPGYHGDRQETDFLREKAYQIGYPVIVKAVAGGGGKGMRRVTRHQDAADAIDACKREAKAAFGDDRMLVEKYVSSPRHIEMQVFADAAGNAVHLFERDCSMQRRHQKIVEEAPAPGLTEEMRAAMGEAAVAAAKAVGYVGAGTVEFIADASRGLRADAFYFMEMNTRLQVEHPVTEMITGLDLVELQFRVAAGEALPVAQGEVAASGHAIEARLYAEDPAGGFLPQSGRLVRLSWPEETEDLRVDTGVEEGAVISPHYDPMIAKLIAHGSDREAARRRLVDALERTAVLGLRTNLGFLSRVLCADAFVEATFDTGFVDGHAAALVPRPERARTIGLTAAGWLEHLRLAGLERDRRLTDEPASPWSTMTGWTLGLARTDRLHLTVNGMPADIDLSWTASGELHVEEGETETRLDAARFETASDGTGHLRLRLDGHDLQAVMWRDEAASAVYLDCDGEHFDIREQALRGPDEVAGGGTIVRAPMSGRIVSLLVAEGDRVAAGDRLAILEAMKMEHPLVAGADAVVTSFGAGEGDQVSEGDIIVSLEPVDGES
ncbi:biotin/lipoyl-binding protein [Kaustia mangrovi]|uniref:Biotin/lipoyl-binding protein n=1 Tax=Kaustia mangrovi TaxID=2593653 RepID=A0A7S8C109_9HYPH|nr:biotin carboxylase N-terminal domain-containing protein [Kaustia mangrovi]QPC41403.1 biotin/lipoyl-binding protein [Kaustia mangrovi]